MKIWKTSLIITLIVIICNFQVTQVVHAINPVEFTHYDNAGDVQYFSYNSSTLNYDITNVSRLDADIVSISFDYSEVTGNTTFSLTTAEVPTLDGSFYANLQLEAENYTTHYRYDVSFGAPLSNVVNTSEVGFTIINGTSFEGGDRDINASFSGSTISWEVDSSEFFDASIIFKATNPPIIKFSGEVQVVEGSPSFWGVSHYIDKTINTTVVGNVTTILNPPITITEEGLLDIFDPVAILILLIIPVGFLGFRLITRSKV